MELQTQCQMTCSLWAHIGPHRYVFIWHRTWQTQFAELYHFVPAGPWAFYAVLVKVAGLNMQYVSLAVRRVISKPATNILPKH